MSDARTVHGRCLCGAVTVSVQVDNPILRACHCDMCRRHTSGMFISLATVPGTGAVTGPAQSFRSSDWAERGFCGTCGSTLWYGAIQEGARNFAAGLFENAADAPLKLEFFADKCPQGYALAGAHRKMTGEEAIAMFAGGSGGDA
ncbi:GFA family protein [Sulfitobacter sabulilitoris]|uniref:GFA family protein n=1 Tax=Sulfitobacter sabulilitoris TaxID=2562655 RepID=A0A5S3Q758_9RHOB|nr:GFA family protein [Sulfitobacter sabulilitoris]TMM52683.1 GFA family protein [Sulfitobacter sabulilitoris]